MTIALNCTTSYGNDGITSYQHVFNVDYNCPVISIESSDLIKVVTVVDLASYCEENKLKTFLKEQRYNIDKVLQSKNETVSIHTNATVTVQFSRNAFIMYISRYQSFQRCIETYYFNKSIQLSPPNMNPR